MSVHCLNFFLLRIYSKIYNLYKIKEKLHAWISFVQTYNKRRNYDESYKAHNGINRRGKGGT